MQELFEGRGRGRGPGQTNSLEVVILLLVEVGLGGKLKFSGFQLQVLGPMHFEEIRLLIRGGRRSKRQQAGNQWDSVFVDKFAPQSTVYVVGLQNKDTLYNQ